MGIITGDIGYMGGISFVCSADTMRTFKDFSRSADARWEKHELFGRKPVLEFVGPDVEEISISIKLSSDRGINPADELEKLREMRDKGEVFPLVIGGKTIGDNLWCLESMHEGVIFWIKGRMQSVDVSLKLREYVEAVT